MDITIISGVAQNGVYQPTDNTDWSELGTTPFGTWSSWTSWHPTPNSVEIQVDEDTGSSDLRSPLLDLRYQGTATVSLKISDSGSFSGEETTYTLSSTPTSVIAGRYYRFTINVAQDSNTGVPLIFSAKIGFGTNTITEYQRAVDTATLGGTIDSRPLSTNIGMVRVLVATALEGGVTYSSRLLQDRVYAIPDDYVFQENAIIVNTVQKNPPTIRCFDLNGESIDAEVDIYIEGLPKILLSSEGVILQ